MYRHKRVMRVMGEAESIVVELFARYQQNPCDLPPNGSRPPAHEGETAARAADRQFHRWNDRPLRIDRASEAF